MDAVGFISRRISGSPAWAGIDLAAAVSSDWRRGFPRVGGDRPDVRYPTPL